MLAGDRVQARPVGGETVFASATVPEKFWRLVTVMVEVPAVPALTVTLVGLAVRVKSWILNTTSAVWVSDPLVPVTRTSSFWADV